MLREVELSTTRACMLCIKAEADGTTMATWHLPASKTDQAAVGVARSHFCCCPVKGAPQPGCPVHALWDQVLTLRRIFKDKFVDGAPTADLPLFPDRLGRVVSKEHMTQTIVEAARFLGVATSAPDGSTRISGTCGRSSSSVGGGRQLCRVTFVTYTLSKPPGGRQLHRRVVQAAFPWRPS